MRYSLHHHPAFPAPLSKDDLYVLVERGSLARGDLCTDLQTGMDHTVGEVVNTMRPPRDNTAARVGRPAYQEFRADSPLDALDEAAAEGEAPEDTFAYTDSGERILYHTRPSWLAYSKALFLALLLAIAAGMLFMFEGKYFIAALIGSLVTIAGTAIARYTHDCFVTEERVEVVWGVIGRSSHEVRICDIRSIDVHESGIKGLLGLGTVDFSSAANAGVEVKFQDIRRAHDVKQLLRQLQKKVSQD
ncbi:MAG: PH domain-containing protein [Prosthecobacter sp.]|nr:PH domain-containing protein [Prosthecobacter sp.]